MTWLRQPPGPRLEKRATNARHYRQWTAEDDRALRRAWDSSASLKQIARSLNRTELTTYYRAGQLGLPRGCPRGCEYLRVSAKRTGFAPESLAMVLRWAGVQPLPVRARPRPDAKSRAVFRYVDPLDVDDAVARWVRSEVVEQAAKARGLSAETLKRLLLAAGQKPPRRRKGRWHLDPEVIDRVVAAHRARLAASASVAEHARRLGMDRTVLGRRLRAAGVLGPKRPGNSPKISNDVVERVVGRRAA